MTRTRIPALQLAAAAFLCAALLVGFAPAVRAQGALSPASPSQKIVKARFQVVRMTYQSIQVANPDNPRELHTFTYSPQIRPKMQNLFNAGGYQYGDRVVIWYSGANVALKIKGKPSKPN